MKDITVINKLPSSDTIQSGMGSLMFSQQMATETLVALILIIGLQSMFLSS